MRRYVCFLSNFFFVIYHYITSIKPHHVFFPQNKYIAECLAVAELKGKKTKLRMMLHFGEKETGIGNGIVLRDESVHTLPSNLGKSWYSNLKPIASHKGSRTKHIDLEDSKLKHVSPQQTLFSSYCTYFFQVS